jgi:hypothetical protein
MALGGRLASESRIKKFYRQVGGAGIVSFSMSAPYMFDRGTRTISTGSNTVSLFDPSYIPEGSVALCAGIAYGCSWSGPAGWTVLHAGSVGSMTYYAAWKRLTAEDVAAGTYWTWTTSMSPGWPAPPAPDPTGRGFMSYRIYTGGGYDEGASALDSGYSIVTNTPTTATAAATFVQHLPSAGWLYPIQTVLCTPNPPNAGMATGGGTVGTSVEYTIPGMADDAYEQFRYAPGTGAGSPSPFFMNETYSAELDPYPGMVPGWAGAAGNFALWSGKTISTSTYHPPPVPGAWVSLAFGFEYG